MFIFFFFFKQKTAYEMRISDWSSDVCSSDLRAGGAIALKLVVLDEIDTRLEQPRHLCGSRLGIEPDARLDDRADHRATVDARQRPRACDAELRALVAIEEHRRQLEIEQPEPGEGLQFRSEEHTSELHSPMRSSYAVFCLQKKNKQIPQTKAAYNHQKTEYNLKRIQPLAKI